MKRRDRRLITPYRTSLTVGKSGKQSTLFDEDFSCDAVHESMGQSNPEKEMITDTSSAFYLNGEGTSRKKENEKEEEKSESVSESGNRDKHNEIISIKAYSSDNAKPSNPKNTVSVFGPDKKRLKNTRISKAKKWIKQGKARQVKDKSRPGEFAIQLLNKPVGKIRVPVLNPDRTPAMPAKSSRVRKWIEEGKVVPKRTKTGIFYIQLIEEPSGKKKQDIVATIDPGSRYTGIAVCSKKDVLYGCNLELIGDEKENSFASIKYRNDKRRELRRSRRYRKCRRRPSRFLNRTKTGKMAPSIRARKQLELKEIKDLSIIYPINIIGVEDVAFNHYTKRWGKNFSQVEVGKKWLFEELMKLVGKGNVRLIKGWDTNIRREQLGLNKSSKKEERDPSAHVNDCIAMGSIILGLGIYIKTKLRLGVNFDIITRPKFSRRKLHNEQVNIQDKRLRFKSHRQRKRFGGTTTDWTKIRKGDYVEAIRDKQSGEDMLYRGWVGGFENDKHLISLYNFDWKVVGQFDNKKVRLMNRNHGLLVKNLEMEENRMNICKYGTEQLGIDNAW